MKTNPTTGGDVDVSELLLEHEEDACAADLGEGKGSDVARVGRDFRLYVGRANVNSKVRKDQEFSLKPQEEIKYKLNRRSADQGSDSQLSKAKRIDRDWSARSIRLSRMKKFSILRCWLTLGLIGITQALLSSATAQKYRGESKKSEKWSVARRRCRRERPQWRADKRPMAEKKKLRGRARGISRRGQPRARRGRL